MEQAQSLLNDWPLQDRPRGDRNLALLQRHVPAEHFDTLCEALTRQLPRCASPDVALNYLERLLATSQGSQRVPWLLAEGARSLEILVQIFSTSHSFSDLLIANPQFLDMIRVPLRRSPSRAELERELMSEVQAAFEDSAVLRAFRHFRQRQLLRIGTNDVIRERSFEEITHDISVVADVALECALATATAKLQAQFGKPMTADGNPSRCVVLSFGKHGGEELNYSSDIDVMVVYDEEGATAGDGRRTIENSDFYRRVVREIVRLLSSSTEHGIAYRVDLRLRPEGERGPLARSVASTLSYYDTLGRTWERQALIKVRPTAGDRDLGDELVRAIEPFVYRKYLNFAEINGIKALKRKIEQRTKRAGADLTEVKTGRGGIRDIEFVVQFLQLLNGGDLIEVRQRSTLKAIQALERVGCLSHEEAQTFESTYRFLRKTEHRLQLLFDLQTHRLPDEPEQLELLAQRMGLEMAEVAQQAPPPAPSQQRRPDEIPPSPRPEPEPRDRGTAFMAVYRQKTEKTRQILDHLLHQTFEGDEVAQPESDLILDPSPGEETIRRVLERYRFDDPVGAYKQLMELARESVRFLSDRRCRHFLASIAPNLLRALAETPDPYGALVNLEQVTASLGAKSVLWELFSFHPPSLKLYVDLCANSRFLSEILIKNPGMIDELLDTLVLNQPRTREELQTELAELCKGVSLTPQARAFGERRPAKPEAGTASSLEPILHSFQAKELMRIGVRDVLGKSGVRETSRALTDLAETLLRQIAELQGPLLEKRMGRPMVREDGKRDRPSRYALLALGKLGSAEMSYHSDLDLILIYEGDGQTRPPDGSNRFDEFELTSNVHFFTELAQRIIKMTSHQGPMGRLYEIDMRLRPTGRSGALTLPLAEFQRYYRADGGAQLWERQALTRARVVYGEDGFADTVGNVVRNCAYKVEWSPEHAEEILSMRKRLEGSRSERNLKRGFGGLVDVEFLVQLFHLKHGARLEGLRCARGVVESLSALWEAGLLTNVQHDDLAAGYELLLRCQGRLRIMHNRSLDEVPEDPVEVERLAKRLGYEDREESTAADGFLAEWERHAHRTRELFLELVDREREDSPV